MLGGDLLTVGKIGRRVVYDVILFVIRCRNKTLLGV